MTAFATIYTYTITNINTLDTHHIQYHRHTHTYRHMCTNTDTQKHSHTVLKVLFNININSPKHQKEILSSKIIFWMYIGRTFFFCCFRFSCYGLRCLLNLNMTENKIRYDQVSTKHKSEWVSEWVSECLFSDITHTQNYCGYTTMYV